MLSSQVLVEVFTLHKRNSPAASQTLSSSRESNHLRRLTPKTLRMSDSVEADIVFDGTRPIIWRSIASPHWHGGEQPIPLQPTATVLSPVNRFDFVARAGQLDPGPVARSTDIIEDDEDHDQMAVCLTQDIYSVAILAGAGFCPTAASKLWSFVLATVCFVAQSGSLVLAILDLQPDGSSLVCCTRLLGHPVNVSRNVRMGQWLAVGFSIFSLENIICMDTLAFINTLASLAFYPDYKVKCRHASL